MFEYLVPIGGTVWEGSGGVALPEEKACHWGWGLRFEKLMSGSVSAASGPGYKGLSLLLYHHVCLLSAMIIMDYPLKLWASRVALVMMSLHSNETLRQNYVYVYASCACLVPAEVGKGCCIPLNCCHLHHVDVRNPIGFSLRASALNCWAISLVTNYYYF